MGRVYAVGGLSATSVTNRDKGSPPVRQCGFADDRQWLYRGDVSVRYIDRREAVRVLELAILGLLHESPMHGYELRKQLTTKLGAFRAAISYGSLYPTLRRLQA